MDLAKEVADNLDKLVVDEKGVLVEIPKFDLFFDRKRAINKMVNATIPIMKETLQHFGERGIKEAQDAKPK